MKLNDVSMMGKYQNDIQKNFRMWVEILTQSEMTSSEFKYAYDMFKGHVDHFRYLDYNEMMQKPVEAIQPIVV